MKQGIRLFFLIISLLCGGFVYYQKLTVGLGFFSFWLAVIYIVSSLIAALIQTEKEIKYIHIRLSGLFVWAVSNAMLFTIIFCYYKLRNLSPILFSTKYYWEEGLDVEFRKNGTYKAINSDLFKASLSYGEYTMKDSIIVLKDRLKFGNSIMKDTLIVSNEGLSFELDRPYRIEKDTMSFEYATDAAFLIVNNASHTIDSIDIRLSYTKEKMSTLSLKSGQQINYDFKSKNSYLDGNYQLIYKMKTKSNGLKKVSNFLNGYPLGTVTKIEFNENNILIHLIFGKTILLNYK
jgi:hypothetical protein